MASELNDEDLVDYEEVRREEHTHTHRTLAAALPPRSPLLTRAAARPRSVPQEEAVDEKPADDAKKCALSAAN
jgi:hypothetical protein